MCKTIYINLFINKIFKVKVATIGMSFTHCYQSKKNLFYDNIKTSTLTVEPFLIGRFCCYFCGLHRIDRVIGNIAWTRMHKWAMRFPTSSRLCLPITRN